MKLTFIIILSFLTGLTSFSQENYEWEEISRLTIYKTKSPIQFDDSTIVQNLDTIELKADCDLTYWKPALSSLPKGPSLDIALEPTYLFVCEFKNGEVIPFNYFPKQRALFDLRQDHFNYEIFPKEFVGKVDKAFAACLKCVMEVNCRSEK